MISIDAFQMLAAYCLLIEMNKKHSDHGIVPIKYKNIIRRKITTLL